MEIRDSTIKNEAAILTSKYNSISRWDTATNYTYQLQEIFDKGSKLITFVGRMKDLEKKDSNYILKVNSRYSKFKDHYFAEILVPPNKISELLKALISKTHYKDGCFILRNVKVKSTSTLDISSELYDPVEGEEPSSYLYYDFEGRLFILRGELVDFYLYKEPETIDN